MLHSLSLHQNWNLSCLTQRASRPALPEVIAASVPGCVHTDLMAAGLLADPYLDLNEIRQDWVGRQDWAYAARFDLADMPQDHAELMFEGLDTFAAVCLNGALLGETANMNRSYRFDVTGHLKAGENLLEVRFRSAWEVGRALDAQYAPRPNNYPGPANLMRKMACSFGWDWGPTTVTSGIWKPVRLEFWSLARLESVQPSVTVEGGDGLIRLKAGIAGEAEGGRLLVRCAGVEASVPAAMAEVELRCPNPELWWPHHLGQQPLYLLEVDLVDANGVLLDRWSRKIGFRSVRLDTSTDEIGRAFTLVVNDVPVFACGANWIPDDCFLPRVTPERYRARIAQARAAHINLLRVWGGGIYETDAFYEACDEAGLMVWQDFLFACAAYPEEEPLKGEILAEARENVARLMPHPSLVLWNGNNENIWGFFDWGWQEALDGRDWGLGYYLKELPQIMAEIDPGRPYWAGSPYSGTMEVHPNSPAHGCTHVWDVWNDVGYEVYRHYIPRFCSEFGWQGPPTWGTLKQSLHDDPLTPDSPGVAHHQKATKGNFRLLRGLQGHLPQPESMEDWHFLTSLNQARAIEFGIAHMRSHRGTCMGAVVWQLNDCWPVNSWAAIDGYGREKLLWYALRRVFAPHFLTIQPRGAELAVIAVNERSLFWRGPVKMIRMRLDGTVLAEFTHWRLCADRFDKAELVVPVDLATPDNPAEEVLVVTLHEERALWYFVEDTELRLPEPRARFHFEASGEGLAVTITAESFLKDICLMPDHLHPEAKVDDALVTLLPGEQRTFRITSPVALDTDALQRAPVLRFMNPFAAGRA